MYANGFHESSCNFRYKIEPYTLAQTVLVLPREQSPPVWYLYPWRMLLPCAVTGLALVHIVKSFATSECPLRLLHIDKRNSIAQIETPFGVVPYSTKRVIIYKLSKDVE